MESPDLDMDRLRGIPLVLAGWLRYRMAVDDDGRPMELSPDPMAERLGRQLERIQLGGCLQMEHIRESEHVLRPEGVPGSEIREASGRSCRMRRSLEWIFLRPDWQTG